LGIVGASSTERLVAGYSDEALEELFPGTLESFIKPTLWLDKPSLTQHF
jgi:hypothetical protein